MTVRDEAPNLRAALPSLTPAALTANHAKHANGNSALNSFRVFRVFRGSNPRLRPSQCRRTASGGNATGWTTARRRPSVAPCNATGQSTGSQPGQMAAVRRLARMRRVHIMSARAKRVLYPALAVWLVIFVSFVVNIFVLGTSAFPGGGKFVDGRYLVSDHGKTIALTVGEYWFSYVHGIVMVSVLAVVVALIAIYYWRGDLRDEYRDA